MLASRTPPTLRLNKMERIIVKVSADFLELSRNYLLKRISELGTLNDALAGSRFDEIRAMSHKTKGTAASYGLKHLGELARDLEQHSKNRDTTRARAVLDEMKTHLESVEIVA